MKRMSKLARRLSMFAGSQVVEADTSHEDGCASPRGDPAGPGDDHAPKGRLRGWSFGPMTAGIVGASHDLSVGRVGAAVNPRKGPILGARPSSGLARTRSSRRSGLKAMERASRMPART